MKEKENKGGIHPGRPTKNQHRTRRGASGRKKASKGPSESPTPRQKDKNDINRNPNKKRSNLIIIHSITTAYITTSMDGITSTAHTAVDNMHDITIDVAYCCSTSL